MTAQDTIPEDIMQAAQELAKYTGWYQRNDALNMAKAMLSERQRCASLAEQKIYPWSIAAGEELHDAIMRGDVPIAPKGGEA